MRLQKRKRQNQDEGIWCAILCDSIWGQELKRCRGRHALHLLLPVIARIDIEKNPTLSFLHKIDFISDFLYKCSAFSVLRQCTAKPLKEALKPCPAAITHVTTTTSMPQSGGYSRLYSTINVIPRSIDFGYLKAGTPASGSLSLRRSDLLCTLVHVCVSMQIIW